MICSDERMINLLSLSLEVSNIYYIIYLIYIYLYDLKDNFN